jgi:hypothetical protein
MLKPEYSMAKTLEDVNDDFARIWSNSAPIRGLAELDAAIRAAGLSYEDVTNEWLHSLREDWVFIQSDAPFDDEQANRAYRKEMRA